MAKRDKIFSLLIKGLIVYLVVMGTMGSFLSSVGAEYSVPVVNVAVLLSALYCALLYYKKSWENVGYLLLLLLIGAEAYLFRTYINSGFYSVINAVIQEASDYFGTAAARSYGEQVQNTRLAVTLAMCFVGLVACILVNILLSRKMHYTAVLLVSVVLLFYPLYLELEPSPVYVVMLFAGFFTAFILKRNGHYRLKTDADAYQYNKKRTRMDYAYAPSVEGWVMALLLAACVLTALLASLLHPADSYGGRRHVSALKAKSMDTMENLSIMGVMGLLNLYPNTGGLTSGTLGGVSSVRLDYNTDLELTLAPYTYDRIYLKTFVGTTYKPYDNQWERGEGTLQDGTVEALKRAYENGGAYSAKGVMEVTNVAAAAGVYLPYYSSDVTGIVYPGQTEEYVFYTSAVGAELDDFYAVQGVSEYLQVPEENRQAVAAFAEEAGLHGTAEDVIAQLTDYFQQNILYTLRPGMTPRRKDFVNYFLEENRRGYCAHFASAAVLTLRYMGVPCRYVEGYAIDAAELFEDAELLADKDYDSYYDGYSELGRTGVVKVAATDANAHAWVEVYDVQRGWYVVEVTPYSEEEDEEGMDLWTMLMQLLGGSQDGSDRNADEAEEGMGIGAGVRRFAVGAGYVLLFAVFGVMLAALLLRIVRWIRQYFQYRGSDRNDKLVICYRRRISRLEKKNAAFREQMDYGGRIRWLMDAGLMKLSEQEYGVLVALLERAGFSGKEISEEEFETACGLIKRLENRVFS